MLAYWSALMLFASGLSVNFEHHQPISPGWVQAAWHEEAQPLAEAFNSVMGPVERFSVHTAWAAMPPGRLDIDAFTEGTDITIRLQGEGWGEESPKGRALLTQNLAHEMAHVWQLAAYDSAFEPRWLHEGFAEALSVLGLARAGLWGADEFAAWEGAATARCAAALERGPLIAAFETGETDAAYGCGYVILDHVREVSGTSLPDIFAIYHEAAVTGWRLGPVARDMIGQGPLARLRRFVYEDHSKSSGALTIRALRAGRL